MDRKLKSIANPKSEYRIEAIKNLSIDRNVKVVETDRQEVDNAGNGVVHEVENSGEELENIEDMMKSLTVGKSKAVEIMKEFTCKECNAKYKKEGNLKLQLKNKTPSYES